MDQTEKGWFIAYIDRDPETIARQEALAKKEKLELDDEERTQRFIQQQVEKALESKTVQVIEEPIKNHLEYSSLSTDCKIEN